MPHPVAMNSTVQQIRSKPTQANNDVAEKTHDEEAAERDVIQPVGQQKAKLPGQHDERPHFLFVPRPVAPQFSLGPQHAKNYRDGAQARGNAAKKKRDAGEGTHPDG